MAKSIHESLRFKPSGIITPNRTVLAAMTNKQSHPNGEISDDFNPNGSVNNIAGIINKKQNVLGMIPHPERSCEKELGSTDGNYIFKSIMKSVSLA